MVAPSESKASAYAEGPTATRRLSYIGASMRNLATKNMYHDSTICSVMYLEEPMPVEQLRQLAAKTFAKEWRFCSTVRTLPNGQHVWNVSDQEPDLTFHCVERAIPTTKPAADQADLYEHIGGFFGASFDETKPLWILETITNLKNAGPDGNAGGAVLFRIHHVIGDGISLIDLVLKLFDPAVEKQFKKNAPKPKADIWPHLPAVFNLCHSVRTFVVGIFDGLLLPMMPGDISSPLKHPDIVMIGGRKVATSPSVDLNKVKEIKDAIGATVNDVLVAALAGTLKRYCESKGVKELDGQVRAMCLINMRKKNRMGPSIKLENKWNFLPIPLPLSEPDPLERMYESKRMCDDAKASPMALVAYKVNAAACQLLPSDMHCQLTYDLFNKCTTVFSNVPGPADEMSMFGRKVLGIAFFANSLTGTVFGLVSYNNKVALSVVADKNVVTDPLNLVGHFKEEIEAQHAATRGTFRKPRLLKREIAKDLLVTILTLIVLYYLLHALLLGIGATF